MLRKLPGYLNTRVSIHAMTSLILTPLCPQLGQSARGLQYIYRLLVSALAAAPHFFPTGMLTLILPAGCLEFTIPAILHAQLFNRRE